MEPSLGSEGEPMDSIVERTGVPCAARRRRLGTGPMRVTMMACENGDAGREERGEDVSES